MRGKGTSIGKVAAGCVVKICKTVGADCKNLQLLTVHRANNEIVKPATNIQLRHSFGASSHSTSSTFDQSNGLTAAVSRHHSTVATPTSEAKLHISSQL